MRLFLRILFIFLFYVSSVGWIWQKSIAKKNNEGKKLYTEGKIDEALSKWRDAQIKSPDRKELHYNIGSALHQQKKYEDAFNEYEKSLDSKDDELQAKTYYNIGNTHYRMGKLPEAIEDYENALSIDPDDEDAKYNIEFIKKKMEDEPQEETQESQGAQAPEEKKEEDRGKGEEKKEERSEKEEEEKESKKEEKDSEGKKDEKKEEEGQKGQEEPSPKDQEADQRPKEGEMSKEDAIRLLDALKDDEKELQEQLRVQPMEGGYRVERDW